MYRDKDWLEMARKNGYQAERHFFDDKYLTQKLSPRKIQAINGNPYPCGHTIAKRLRSLGYPVRPRGGHNNHRQVTSIRARIEALPGHERMTTDEIAVALQVSAQQVGTNCWMHGIKHVSRYRVKEGA